MRKVSLNTIYALEKIITGNPTSNGYSLAPYQTATDLIQFFQHFGLNIEIGSLSRKMFTERNLIESNGKEILFNIIEQAFDIRRFFETDFKVDESVQYINTYLKFDGLILRRKGEVYRLVDLHDLVNVNDVYKKITSPNQNFIKEQILKCEQKIENGDYDGAITNARTLVESFLIDIEKKLTNEPSTFDGDLIKLYKRVQKMLNLDPSQKDLNDNLRQVLSGLTSVINGLSSVRNNMSDAHASKYRPNKHHAKLVVNSSRTLVNFLFDTFEYQKVKL